MTGVGFLWAEVMVLAGMPVDGSHRLIVVLVCVKRMKLKSCYQWKNDAKNAIGLIVMLERVSSGCDAGGMILREVSIVMVSIMLASTFCRSARKKIREFGEMLMMKVMKWLKPKKVK